MGRRYSRPAPMRVPPARRYPRSSRGRLAPGTPGLNGSLERLFEQAPLGLPLVLIGAGVIFIIAGHQAPRYIIPLGVILIAGGAVTLPFGIHRVAKRRLNPTVLQCPKCSLESRTMAEPFKVQKWNDVNYWTVTCSVCGHDFEVPRGARLV